MAPQVGTLSERGRQGSACPPIRPFEPWAPALALGEIREPPGNSRTGSLACGPAPNAKRESELS
jgi:hypothetical protein